MKKNEQTNSEGILLTFRKSFQILDRSDQKKSAGFILVNLTLSFLDILAVGIFGIVGSLSVSGIAGTQATERVAGVISILGLETKTLQFQVTLLGGLAALLLTSKSLLSLYLSKKTLLFLNNRSAILSSRLVERFLSQDLERVNNKSLQETIYALTSGVNTVIVGLIGGFLLLIADLSIIIFFSVSLFAIDTLVASMSLCLFLVVGAYLYKKMQRRSRFLGEAMMKLGIETNNRIAEVVNTYRELLVKNAVVGYSRKISQLRFKAAGIGAQMGVMPLVSKYILEITLVAGVLVIGAVQFMLQPATRAAAVTSIFLLASARILPAVLRLQNGALALKSSIGSAKPTLGLIQEFEEKGLWLPRAVSDTETSIPSSNFISSISVSNLSFKYSNNSKFVFEEVNLEIKQGEFVGIIGPSGSGKSTLADLFLGIIKPTEGEVLISGMSPWKIFSLYPGLVAYVPQDCYIVNGTLRENICLGLDNSSFSETRIVQALEIVQLTELLDLPGGLDAHLGERGGRLSGGQRQRIGIARALLSEPKLLIMDEATSSLDALTEKRINEYLESIRKKVTVVLIAHRLSSIRKADKIYYIERGRKIEEGSFNDLRKRIKKLDNQAKELGI